MKSDYIIYGSAIQR